MTLLLKFRIIVRVEVLIKFYLSSIEKNNLWIFKKKEEVAIVRDQNALNYTVNVFRINYFAIPIVSAMIAVTK